MDSMTISRGNRFLESANIKENSASSLEQKTGGATDVDKSFSDTLKEAVGSVNEMQVASNKAMQNLATGRTDNVADVMIAAEKADIALRVMVQVRNKIIDAYQEIMKMQV
jgi:flagellar hook-basal body complex protein FliE